MIFLEWVSLRVELKNHQRAGSRRCTCPVAHPHSSCIHFTFGFPSQCRCHALVGQVHSCHAGGQQMINRHVFHLPTALDLCMSLERQAGLLPLSLVLALTWRMWKSGKRVLHYCQARLTGNSPLIFLISASTSSVLGHYQQWILLSHPQWKKVKILLLRPGTGYLAGKQSQLPS